MFENFKPFHIESKDSIMMKTEITGKLDSDGAKEVATETNKIVAQGKKWFWIFTGFGFMILIICYGLSMLKWW